MIKQSKNRAGVTVFALATQPKARSRKEDMEAIDFYQFAIRKYPEVKGLLRHIANERKASVHEHNLLVQQGMEKGTSDYLMLIPNDDHPYFAMELKRARKKDSSVQKEQNEFLLDAESVGAFACIAYGYKAALHALDVYMKNMSKPITKRSKKS
jgi:hypothetical protein